MSAAQKIFLIKFLGAQRKKFLALDTVLPQLNFPQRLKVALKLLREDPTIIVAKADKGDTVMVMMDVDHYYGLAAKHLQTRLLMSFLKQTHQNKLS